MKECLGSTRRGAWLHQQITEKTFLGLNGLAYFAFVSDEESLMALTHKDNVTKLFSQKNFPGANSLAYFAFVSDKDSLMVSSHMRQHYKTFFSKKLSLGKQSSLLCSFASNEEKVLVALSQKDNFTKLFLGQMV